MEAELLTWLRGVAREVRQLAYTGAWDKEGPLLDLADRVDGWVQRLERTVYQVE